MQSCFGFTICLNKGLSLEVIRAECAIWAKAASGYNGNLFAAKRRCYAPVLRVGVTHSSIVGVKKFEAPAMPMVLQVHWQQWRLIIRWEYGFFAIQQHKQPVKCESN